MASITRGQVHQEDIKIPNVYAPNNITSKYIKEKLVELQEEMDNPVIIVYIYIYIVNRTSTQKIRKDIEDLNKTVNHLDLIGIYRSTQQRNTSFSKANGTFVKIDHILGH